MFCDVEGSTALGEQLDPEALASVLGGYFEAISSTIERHGGTVHKYAGDAVLAVFGIPQVHEDDALRAVRAAVEINRRLPSVASSVGVALRLRIGINTGLVLTDEAKTLALGDAVNVAARLEQTAAPGEIVLGADTLRLVRDAVEVEPLEPLSLKGKSEPVSAFRLLRLDPVAPGVAGRLDVPLVGRERELQLLRDVWRRTVEASRCHVLTLLGMPGLGKSRLAEELVREVADDAMVLRGRCLHYGEGITFWPIFEALSVAGPRADRIRQHLASGGVAAPEELFWEVRQLLESLAEQRPLILYVDDLQWAEPMLIDLLIHVARLARTAPILILGTARPYPHVFEDRGGWDRAEANLTTVRLEALDAISCEQLLAELAEDLVPEQRAQIIRASEGNPLFLQEMAVFACERGTVEIPPTIQGLLEARLERLGTGQRELLARGAVEGQVFHRSAICALIDADTSEDVSADLAGLVRKNLIQPHPGNVPGDEAFRFRHLLIRDAAYERLPKATRADLHLRYAHWLEATAVNFVEVDEIAGWHLEQAVRYELELGRDADPELVQRAAEHLYAAGRRAADRSDIAAAKKLLERALMLADERDAPRIRISVALAELLTEAGELARADELLSLAEDAEDRGALTLSRLEWLLYARPREAAEMIESAVPRMVEELSRSGDERALGKAHWLAFWGEWTANRATGAAAHARLAAEHARSAGDVGLWSRALGWYVATLMYGPRDARAIAAELETIEREQPGPYLTACVELGRAEVERLAGRFDEARRLADSALDRFRTLGMRTMAAMCGHSLASIELSSGDAHAALVPLQRSEALLAEFGERAIRSTTQAMLARAYEQLGASDEARSALELAEQLSAPREVANFASTYGVRARLALRDGDLAAAERAARSALTAAEGTDFIGVQAEARLGLARVLAARSSGEAVSEANTAAALFEAKGDRPGGDASRALLRQLSSSSRSAGSRSGA